MKLILMMEDIFNLLFPDLPQDGEEWKEILQRNLEEYYTLDSSKPVLHFMEDHVIIEIDTGKIRSETKEYEKVIELCETSRFKDAQLILKDLIQNNPTNSE